MREALCGASQLSYAGITIHPLYGLRSDRFIPKLEEADSDLTNNIRPAFLIYCLFEFVFSAINTRVSRIAAFLTKEAKRGLFRDAKWTEFLPNFAISPRLFMLRTTQK